MHSENNSQEVTNVHLLNVQFVLRDIAALLDPSWCSGLPTFIHLVRKQERGGGKEGMEGGVRRFRPKFWQRTKCTFVPSFKFKKIRERGNRALVTLV